MTDHEENRNSPTDDKKGKVTKDERSLVVSFIQFLRQKVSSNQCTEDQIEGLEVAVQCLETAFGVSDKNYAFQPSKPLIEIFKAAECLPDGEEDFPTPTQEEIDQANKLKEEGNELVKANKHEEAIFKYNEAIKLNRDPIYFCNRAAAYCRLEQYDLAIQDCRTALALDSNYAKAYGRMGVALSCQNRYDHAVEAYKKALELDPNNESYKNNLSIAEEKLRQAQEAFSQNPQSNPFANMFGPGGLGGLMNNESLSRMMQDPTVRNLMSQMMQNFTGTNPNNANQQQQGEQNQDGSPNAFSEMLRMGEAIANAMHQSNPEFVETLRRQFGPGGPPGGQQNDQQPPPGSV